MCACVRVCVSSWQNVVAETLIVAGSNAEAILSNLAGVYMSVEGQIFVSTIGTQPCKIHSQNFTGVQPMIKMKLPQFGPIEDALLWTE